MVPRQRRGWVNAEVGLLPCGRERSRAHLVYSFCSCDLTL